jgi:hypothetical protein
LIGQRQTKENHTVTTTVGPWTLVDVQWKPKGQTNQGLATVQGPPGSPSHLVFRGSHSVAADLRARGWCHIGDPASWGGAVIDAYQWKDAAATAKLFRVTRDNRTFDFEHPLVTDPPTNEIFNNSLAAVSPDGQWLVSGEWGQVDRLLVFPTPTINPDAHDPRQPLSLAGLCQLAHPVRNVQGAVFLDDTTLLCSTNDETTGLWPARRQLLEVRLSRPLPDLSVPATVRCIGGLPCPTFGVHDPEVEGIDFDKDTGDLRVVIVPKPPIGLLLSGVYRFRRNR